MSSEQEMIYRLFNKLQTNQDISSEIKTIERDYKKSVILQYYLGVVYGKQANNDKAEQKFKKCLELAPRFTPPYFELAKLLKENGCSKEIISIFESIINKPTLDATSMQPRLQYNLKDQLRISSILLPEYGAIGEVKKAKPIYENMIDKLRGYNGNVEYYHFETWKNLCYGFGNILIETECEKSLSLYLSGLKPPFQYKLLNNVQVQEQAQMIHELDKKLLQGLCIARNYNSCDDLEYPSTVNKIYERYRGGDKNIVSVTDVTDHRNRKINIGYLSPDFNKNAVGLFVTAFLKHFNADKFNVHVYYNDDKKDEFTYMFMAYPDINWKDVRYLSDNELYNLIHDQHKIDILVDLIGLGIGNRLECLAKKPAPVIVNYLGYPDFTHLKEVTHRLVDGRSDPVGVEHAYKNMDYCEKLLRMPRCFLCYHLFDNVKLPDIDVSGRKNDKLVHIGIMNKYSKHSKTILEVWKRILKERPNYILYFKANEKNIKHSDLYKGFNASQIKFLDFTPDLPSYFQQFNQLDMCLDTYPYSGTTTTCSSLLMGVPVYTVYIQSNRHVSNVTGSILSNMETCANYICNSLEEYLEKAKQFQDIVNCERDVDLRRKRRQQFLESMDPIEFMKDYESLIEGVYNGD